MRQEIVPTIDLGTVTVYYKHFSVSIARRCPHPARNSRQRAYNAYRGAGEDHAVRGNEGWI